MKVIIEGRVYVNERIIQTYRCLLRVAEKLEYTAARDGGVPEQWVLPSSAAGDLGALQADAQAKDDFAELEEHRDAVENELFPATVVGHPDEDLQRGMVLISCGPVSFEVPVDELQRALRAFED